ncbi:MAG: LPS-assembly protein LptD [Betaproteobacteria bacterium]|nr:LPS-assembly protein LptD [Betaproteobacteria bacterium]
MRRSPLSLAVAAALIAVMAAPVESGAAEGEQSPALKLVTGIRGAGKKPGPRVITAGHVTGVLGQTATATGGVTLSQDGLLIQADTVTYEEPIDKVTAIGRVTMDRDGDKVEGRHLELRLSDQIGTLDKPSFYLPVKDTRRQEAWANASRVHMEGEDRERFTDASYSTCKPGDEDWFMQLSELSLDHGRNVGSGTHARVLFKGVPILYMPYMTFPLNNDRKSGFLPPSFGSSSQSGLEYAQPYYWNIAPNRDATLTPKIFTRRGMQLGTEVRYLEPTLQGQFDSEYLPNDREADQNRYFVGLRHVQNLTGWLPSFGGGWTASINAQKVSDDDYFRDLSTRIANTAQTNLPRDVMLNYGNAHLGLGLRMLSHQTLQDPAAPVIVPYRLAPQLNFAAQHDWNNGLEARVTSDYSDFRHPTLVNGRRFIVNPSVSLPLTRSFGFITPKLGYHHTRYRLSSNQDGFAGGTRGLAIASIDSGLFMERDFMFGDVPLRQTLEPRLYYLYVPYKDQSRLPNFSTAESDFSFAQIFTENIFIGGDRVADANQVTLAATSRFIDKADGAERFRVSVGQRYFFNTPRVTLGTVTNPSTDAIRSSDLLAGLSGQVLPSTWIDTSFQYSTNLSRLEKSALAARYNPEPGKILNVAYRYTRETLRQVDVSTQWPVKPGLRLLARVNHSLKDRRLLEGLLGLEYNHGCWEFRLVAHRFTTATQQYSNSIQFQLELKGLSRLGINPLETLRQNIPGYRRSDEMTP